MIYQGEYYDDYIYGTSNSHKIMVETEDGANFLLCELTVELNGQTWAHSFEVPFFNDIAEFYFENFIHSIITQKFQLPEISKEEYQIHSFNLASVNMVLKEMSQDDELSSLTVDFYMILGNHPEYNINYIDTGEKKDLETLKTAFITKEGIIAFTFFSSREPNKLEIDNGTSVHQINLPYQTTEFKLHTISIPISIINSYIDNQAFLKIKFSDGDILDIGEFSFVEDGPEHNLIAYQNYQGTFSIMECTGELITMDEFKVRNSKYSDNNKTSIKTTSIDENELNTINTGFLLDKEKHNMVKELVKSFNIFLMDDEPIRMILKGNHRLTPYRTNRFVKSETLKFKFSENDDIHYRIF